MTLEVNSDFRYMAIGFLETLIEWDPELSKLDCSYLRNAKERIIQAQFRRDHPDQALTL